MFQTPNTQKHSPVLEDVVTVLQNANCSVTEEFLDDLPNLLRFYRKITASKNKATVEFALTKQGLIITKASKNITGLIGYTIDELVGQPLARFTSGEIDIQQIRDMITELDKGEVVIKSSPTRHKNGHIVILESVIYKDDVRDRYVEFTWNEDDVQHY